ncbi:hypothetical protein EC988_003722 [Linderina pennispora]|nr:hypothetical protein EC988_003722 [Linderina pennispora]
MSIWSFLGQVGTVFRHYVSPARLENLGNLLPDKQILVVTGDQDHMVRTSNSFYIADKIGRDRVRFEQIENAGHGVTNQCPDRFAKSIDTMVMEVAR